MLTKEQFHEKISAGIRILDGATGSNLRNAGMPKGCCTEQWVLENPVPLVTLQRAYASGTADGSCQRSAGFFKPQRCSRLSDRR